MKKKLKSLLIADDPSGNEEIDRLKKALQAANLKFKKAKAARSNARDAFSVAAEQWLGGAKMPHASTEISKKKGVKSGKAGKASVSR